MKKIFIILIALIVIIVSLNFVPIKFAVRYDDYLTDRQYLCYMDIKGGDTCNYRYKWVLQNNNDNIWVKFSNLSPEYQLSTKHFFELHNNIWYDLNNNFVITGEIDYIVDEDMNVAIINIEKWDIVYPIRRKSFRGKFSSQNYLTIYDFDWIKMFWK